MVTHGITSITGCWPAWRPSGVGGGEGGGRRGWKCGLPPRGGPVRKYLRTHEGAEVSMCARGGGSGVCAGLRRTAHGRGAGLPKREGEAGEARARRGGAGRAGEGRRRARPTCGGGGHRLARLAPHVQRGSAAPLLARGRLEGMVGASTCARRSRAARAGEGGPWPPLRCPARRASQKARQGCRGWCKSVSGRSLGAR